MTTRRLDDMDAGNEALRQRELDSYEQVQKKMSENISAELGSPIDESKKKTTPILEMCCPGITLPERYCFFKDGGRGLCGELSRNNCPLYREYATKVQGRVFNVNEIAKAHKVSEKEIRIEMRQGRRESKREIMRFKGSYGGYYFEAESWGNE